MAAMKWTVFGAVSFLAFVAACARMPATPRELIEARAAYQRAATGSAARVAPDQLQLARQSLREAEHARKRSAPVSEVIDRSYVARRKAEAVEVSAEAILADEQRRAAESEIARLREGGGKELREALAEERRRAELAEQQATEERRQAERARQESEQRAAQALREAELAQRQATHESEEARQRAEQARQQAEQAQRQAELAQEGLESERRARQEAELRAQEALARLEREGVLARGPRGLVVTLSGAVLFRSGEAILLPEARTRLEDVATALKASDGAEQAPVIIEGHTDGIGSREFNLLLSQRRADAVRDFLISTGVPPAQLTARGWGEERPVASNRTAEDRAYNRRVEIVIPATNR